LVEGHFPRLSIEGEVNQGGGGTCNPGTCKPNLVLCFGQIRPLDWTKPAKTVTSTTKKLKLWELDSNYKLSQIFENGSQANIFFFK
jgi:hypothetical protein